MLSCTQSDQFISDTPQFTSDSSPILQLFQEFFFFNIVQKLPQIYLSNKLSMQFFFRKKKHPEKSSFSSFIPGDSLNVNIKIVIKYNYFLQHSPNGDRRIIIIKTILIMTDCSKIVLMIIIRRSSFK